MLKPGLQFAISFGLGLDSSLVTYQYFYHQIFKKHIRWADDFQNPRLRQCKTLTVSFMEDSIL